MTADHRDRHTLTSPRPFGRPIRDRPRWRNDHRTLRTGTRFSRTSAATSCKTTSRASSRTTCAYVCARLPRCHTRATTRPIADAGRGRRSNASRRFPCSAGRASTDQALIKPQYVDNVPKLVKGRVADILKGKSQRDNLDAMIDALGTSTPRHTQRTTAQRADERARAPMHFLSGSRMATRAARCADARRHRTVGRRASALCHRHDLHPEGRHVRTSAWRAWRAHPQRLR